GDHRDLHSFPTRRSSDLEEQRGEQGTNLTLDRQVMLRRSRASKNTVNSGCSPPRKSLVKGERFVRVEEKPERAFHMASGPGARTAPGAALTVCLSVYLSVAGTLTAYAWLLDTELHSKHTQNKFKKKKKLSGRLPMHLKAFARAMQGYEGYSQLESKRDLYSVMKT